MREQHKRILVVDDEDHHRAVLVNVLQPHYTLLEAETGEQALRTASATPPPDLIILDVMLPDIDGFEVCRRLKDNPETRNIPVIFLSGMSQTSHETRGFAVGGVDYIIKPVNPVALLVRLQTHLSLASMTDRETSLPNFQLCYQLLNRELRHAVRYRQKLALAVLDVDLGQVTAQETGALMHEIAVRAQQTIRDTDTMARIASGEFALILPTIDSREVAIHVCNKVLETLSKPFMLHEKPYPVQITIGLSLFDEHGQSVDALLQAADQALSTASPGQGNQVVVCRSTTP